jgi:hypothetical protein
MNSLCGLDVSFIIFMEAQVDSARQKNEAASSSTLRLLFPHSNSLVTFLLIVHRPVTSAQL